MTAMIYINWIFKLINQQGDFNALFNSYITHKTNLIWSGVVPQHPPTIFNNPSSKKGC